MARFTFWKRFGKRNNLKQVKAPSRRRCANGRRLQLEPLEERVLPSTITWINSGGGDWDTPTIGVRASCLVLAMMWSFLRSEVEPRSHIPPVRIRSKMSPRIQILTFLEER